MTQLCRFLCFGALLTVLFPGVNRAGTWVAFQNSYTRGTGAPVTVTDT